MQYHPNRLRLFREMRLSPWEPLHELWIKQELASLELEDKEDFDRYRDAYADILKKHQEAEAAKEVEEKPVEEVPETEVVTETVETNQEDTKPAPKKRGRKSVSPSTDGHSSEAR